MLTTLFLTLTLLGSGLPASADRVSPKLAKATTPGSLVLLIEDSRDPRVTARWIEALASPDARIRLLAARLLRQNRPSSAADPLRRALSTEIDILAAREEARTLLEIGAPESAGVVIAAAARLKDDGLMEVLGRTQGARAVREFDRVKTSCGRRSAATLIGAAVARDRSVLSTLPAQVLEDDVAMEAALSSAVAQRVAIPPQWLTTILPRGGVDVRTLAWWSIAVGADTSQLASAAPLPAVNDSDGDPSEGRLGRALALRALGRRVDQDDIVALAAQAVKDGHIPRVVLTAIAEGGIIRLLAQQEAENLPPVLQVRRSMPSTLTSDVNAAPAKYDTMRTPDGLPRGLIRDVLAVSGCKPKPRDGLGAALVRYSPTGRPAQMALLESALPVTCQDAVRALVLTSLLAEDNPAASNAVHVVLLPFEPGFDECAADASPNESPDGSKGPVTIGIGTVSPPTKTKDVRPVYPQTAIDRRVSGIVVLEAMISPQGCVNRARVLHSVEPQLDAEAVRSVIQWRFTPTLLNGVPMPVIMTVSVQFTLR